ncbi:MAG: hypothetical protein F7B59_02440 [Desulfurococcales archaeon]|nr:hypothetical protein [Desulfurococcales archaeon]
MARSNGLYGGYWLLRESVDRATEYIHMRGLERVVVAAASALVLAVNIIIVFISVEPLYRVTGGIANGYIGIVSYKLTILGRNQLLPQMESLRDLSFLLIFASVYSIILILPSILYPSRRVPRIHLETAAAGYIVSELGLTLLVSFLRIIQDNTIPSIPLDGSLRTEYGFFQLAGSEGYNTRFGIMALHMREYFIFIGILFIFMAVILVLYTTEYYREVEEAAPLIPNPS